MPHRHAIRVALAVGLAATTLTAPARPATAAPDPSAAEVAPTGVPAVTLLRGAAPTTVNPGPPPAGGPAAIALTISTPRCPGHPTADGTPPNPCPTQPDWTASTFAVVKQPHPSVDQHATPAVGPSAPALLLLDQLLPRAGLLTGRTTHLEPGPA